jgi:hypothetical protein
MKRIYVLLSVSALLAYSLPGAAMRMSRAEYEDRIQAAWTAEIIGTLMGFSSSIRLLPSSGSIRSRPASWRRP